MSNNTGTRDGEWLQNYKAADGNSLNKEHNLIKAVGSDDLDAESIEQKIQEQTSKNPIINGFCSKCQASFDNWPTLGDSSTRQHDSNPDPTSEGWEHGIARSGNTFELEASTRAGCRCCTFLLQTLKDAEVLDIYRKIETRLYNLGEDASVTLMVQNWGTNPSQLLWLNVPGKICGHCNSGVGGSVKFESSFLPASADCFDEPLDVLEIASKWLATCTDSHEACKNSDGGTLPTRLISLAGPYPKLILTPQLSDRPKYATLSHSWGAHDSVKLMSANLDSFMNQLPMDNLPLTFTDTFKIVKGLMLDYVWIDSLCIIQDNDLDWQEESAMMESVYGNSTITIAASSARDSTQGCFLKPALFNDGFRARITDGDNHRVQDFRSQQVYENSTSETHLATRAWALQERLLPARTIHFGDRGAFWECRTTIASEFLPEGFPRQLVQPLVSRKSSIADTWTDIVRLYSTANLTFAKDKLPALSGIARLGFKESGDQYLAGLWRGQIEEQLCWHHWRPEPGSIGKRPVWRAPSWSWAAVDGKVAWQRRQEGIQDVNHAHVLDASIELYGYDPFGQVTGGVIRLTCSGLLAGELEYLKPIDAAKAEDLAKFVLKTDQNEERFLIQLDSPENDAQDFEGLIYMLPILSGETGLGIGTGVPGEYLREILVQGVVLRSTGIKKGEFSRIGFFGLYKDKGRFDEDAEADEETYGSFLEVLGEFGKVMAEEVCAEIIENVEHPEEVFVITLV